MNQATYLSWLSDRGIQTPNGQPFHFIDGALLPSASFVFIALIDEHDGLQLDSVRKLARAIEDLNGNISWLALSKARNQHFAEPSSQMLRTLMPQLSKILLLVQTDAVEGQSTAIAIQNTMLASRPLAIMRAPTLKLMSEQIDLKRTFWNSTKEWLNTN